MHFQPETPSDFNWKSYRMGQLNVAKMMQRTHNGIAKDIQEFIEQIEQEIKSEENNE